MRLTNLWWCAALLVTGALCFVLSVPWARLGYTAVAGMLAGFTFLNAVLLLRQALDFLESTKACGHKNPEPPTPGGP